MASMVLLLHDEPGGGWHYDWMLQRAQGGGEGALVTFRVSVRVDELSAGASHEVAAERLVDHRAAYLRYEGEVSGGRGRVRQMARGECRWVRLDEGSLEAVIAWEGRGERRVRGELSEGGAWRLLVGAEKSR